MFDMSDRTPVAHGLKMGRPDNRKYVYKGDKRAMIENPAPMGPDAHGVYWRPVRAYFDDRKNKTLVVLEPVHPDELRNMGFLP